jgi:hypothetical protein
MVYVLDLEVPFWKGGGFCVTILSTIDNPSSLIPHLFPLFPVATSDDKVFLDRCQYAEKLLLD